MMETNYNGEKNFGESEEVKVLTKYDLYEVLRRNNQQVFELINKRNTQILEVPEKEKLEEELVHENGEALMLIKLIDYLEGKTQFEEVK